MWLELLTLAGVVWVAHFLHFRSLGLYEDDYAHISEQLSWRLIDLIRYLRVAVTWPQGRPLHFLLPHIGAFMAGHLGALNAAYVLAFLVEVANAFLFYLLLRRMGLESTAWLGGLAFGLFPADTTHSFLLHALGIHTSLTFLLIASHLYLSGEKIPAYVMSAGSLLTYESAYMPFLVVPLLVLPWGRGKLPEILRHLAVWIGILLIAVMLRSLMGEGRIEAATSASNAVLSAGAQTAASLVIGPVVSLGLIGYGPAWILFHWSNALTLVFLVSAPFFAWMLFTGPGNPGEAAATAQGRVRVRIPWRESARRNVRGSDHLVNLLIASIALLSLAYGASFTHYPPTALYGRMTSVHAAAALGGGLFFACACGMLLQFASTARRRILVTVLLALYLSVLLAYRFAIQLDFVQAWKNEKAVWTQVAPLVPDVTDGTMVMVLNHDLPTTRFIRTNSWADPIMLAQLYEFPKEWRRPPRLFVLPPDWTKSIVSDGNELRWEVPAATWLAHWETLPDGNVILLEMENGQLVRRYVPLYIHGRVLNLKPPAGPRAPGFTPGPLYQYMLDQH
jgi:hypothetical protein